MEEIYDQIQFLSKLFNFEAVFYPNDNNNINFIDE